MILHNFNYCDKPLLPTPNQILTGIINAQIEQFKLYQSSRLHSLMIESANEMWITIFQLTKSADIDFDGALSHQILSNPDHKFVKAIIYIYSMHTFIFSEINRAFRNKDSSQIIYYESFTSALGYIVHCSNFHQVHATKKSKFKINPSYFTEDLQVQSKN